MSLFHSYHKAKVKYYIDGIPQVNISSRTRTSWGHTEIHSASYDYIVLSFYTLGWYGQAMYHQSWDYWRSDRVHYAIHNDWSEDFHFPFYFLQRNSVFQSPRVVDN